MSLTSKVEVRLTEDERATLQRLVHTGPQSAHATRRARLLLQADAAGPEAWTDARVAEALDLNRMTVSRVRAQFAAEGLDATLPKKKAQDRHDRKRDAAQEARLVALTCADPPAGQARWTMSLLADQLVALEVVEAIDPATVWRTLQKTTSSRG